MVTGLQSDKISNDGIQDSGNAVMVEKKYSYISMLITCVVLPTKSGN